MRRSIKEMTILNFSGEILFLILFVGAIFGVALIVGAIDFIAWILYLLYIKIFRS